MHLEIRIRSAALAEINALPDEALKHQAITMLVRARKRVFGLPLGSNHQTGDLTGCRKIYFDIDEDTQPSWRIVLRYQPDETRPMWVDVIAVGQREGLQAYADAVRRLIEGPDSST